MSRLLFTLKRIVKSDRSKSEHTASERQPRSHGRERGRSERGAGAASVEKGPAQEAGSAAGCEIDNMTLRIDELIITSLGYSNLSEIQLSHQKRRYISDTRLFCHLIFLLLLLGCCKIRGT